MFDFLKRKKSSTAPIIPAGPGLLGRLTQKLSRARASFISPLLGLLRGKTQMDPALQEALEECLLASDMGVAVTDALLKEVTQRLANRESENSSEGVTQLLRTLLYDRLVPSERPLELPSAPTPFVILLVGVNGAGKTTTLGKLAHHFQGQGKKVLLAAGDTFRAAAIEQLQVWG